jgi:hypothetical protein
VTRCGLKGLGLGFLVALRDILFNEKSRPALVSIPAPLHSEARFLPEHKVLGRENELTAHPHPLLRLRVQI